MDPSELAAVLADPPPGLPPIRAVVPVHLYGQVADIEVIGTLCRRHDLLLIEDCAQAHGARRNGRGWPAPSATPPPSPSTPPKTWARLGDGGAVVAREPEVAARIAALRQYGWIRHYISDEVGSEQPPGRIAGGDSAREAAISARRQRPAPGHRARLRRRYWAPARRNAGAGRSMSTISMSFVSRNGSGFRRGCGRGGSARACIIRCRCICNRPTRAVSLSVRQAASKPNARRRRSCRCRCIRS